MADPDDHGDPELHRVVGVHGRVVVGQAEAGEVEHVLDHEAGREHGREGKARAA